MCINWCTWMHVFDSSILPEEAWDSPLRYLNSKFLFCSVNGKCYSYGQVLHTCTTFFPVYYKYTNNFPEYNKMKIQVSKCFSLKSRKSLSIWREKKSHQIDNSHESSVFCTVRAMQKDELISPAPHCLLGAGQVSICALRYCFSVRLKCNALLFYAAGLNGTQINF